MIAIDRTSSDPRDDGLVKCERYAGIKRGSVLTVARSAEVIFEKWTADKLESVVTEETKKLLNRLEKGEVIN